MKQTMKKLMAVLLVMTLAIGITQTTQVATVQAASKMTLADYKNFTGKYKGFMNKCVTTKKYNTLRKTNQISYIGYTDITGEKAPKKCIKTKRGITLLSTKTQVFNKYGKINISKGDPDLKKELCNGAGVGQKSYNLIKNAKWASYSYRDEKYGNYYTLNFFINKNDKVDAIVVTRNML